MSLHQRRQILLAGVALAVWPPSALVQAQGRRVRVAILYSANRAATGYIIDGFIEQMAEFGWREGVNIEYVFREAHGELARLDPLAAELVALKPDLILASTAPVVLAVKKHTSAVPIVFAAVPDPVAAGFVASLSRPGGNATGTTAGFGTKQLWGKRLQILQEAFPSVRRIALLYDSTDAQDAGTLQQLQAAGKELTVC